ncbi:MAG: hypothetical protein JW825_06360 [Candidatus Methanofastidiosa archaeon]|nr:hypothetical protein [Candidatus Methanofastidiosa archaeon]
MALFIMFALLFLGFVRWDVPLIYIVWILFLGVPLLTIAKIACTDLSEFSYTTWKPRRIKKN